MDGSVRRHRAEHPHQLASDFQFDATADGRRLKFLNVSTSTATFAWSSGCAGAAWPWTWWPCTRNSPSSTRLRRTSTAITDRNSSPRPFGTAVRPARPRARLTPSPYPRGRTALQNRSTGGSAMSASTPCCSPQRPRLCSWLIAGHRRTKYVQATFGPPGVRPWRQLNKEVPYDHDHPLS